MVNLFKSKTIANPLSIGEMLKKERLARELSLQEVSRKINVSVKYLEAIEQSKYTKLPGEVYAKSFLKSYSSFLGIDPVKTANAYSSERKVYVKTSEVKLNEFKNPVARISARNLMVTPKILRSAIVGILALAVLGYLGLKLNGIVTPPKLVVTSPADNLRIEQNFIEVAGQAEPETILSINGQQILADNQGSFNELIDLQIGVNIIEIVAEKRHGTQTKVYRQVVVDEKSDEGEQQNQGE